MATTTDIARQLVQAPDLPHAHRITDSLTGRQVAAVARLLGAHLAERTVRGRRRELIAQTIARALNQAAVEGIAGEGLLESWRARKLAELDR